MTNLSLTAQLAGEIESLGEHCQHAASAALLWADSSSAPSQENQIDSKTLLQSIEHCETRIRELWSGHSGLSLIDDHMCTVIHRNRELLESLIEQMNGLEKRLRDRLSGSPVIIQGQAHFELARKAYQHSSRERSPVQEQGGQA